MINLAIYGKIIIFAKTNEHTSKPGLSASGRDGEVMSVRVEMTEMRSEINKHGKSVN